MIEVGHLEEHQRRRARVLLRWRPKRSVRYRDEVFLSRPYEGGADSSSYCAGSNGFPIDPQSFVSTEAENLAQYRHLLIDAGPWH